AHLQAYLKLAAFSVRFEFFRAANVTLAVRRMLEQLPVLVEVAARWLNAAMRFNDQEACIRRVLPNLKTEGRPTRNDDIVSFVIGQQAKVCLKHTMPIMDKVDLVTFAV